MRRTRGRNAPLIAIVLISMVTLIASACSSADEPDAPAQPQQPAAAAAAVTAIPGVAVQQQQPAAAAVAPTAMPGTAPSIPPTATPIEIRIDRPIPVVTGKVTPGGTLVTMESGNLQSLDFHRARSIGTMQWFANIHLNLLEVDTQKRDVVVGDAAESWSVGDNGIEWTFNIRPGLVTHKGMPFNSEDVRYNMQRWLDQPNGVGLLRSGCFRNAVIGMEAPDNDTVIVTTGTAAGGAAPVASFLKCISQAYLLLQPKGIMTAVDAPGQQRDLATDEIDGIGPFIMTDYVPDNIIKSVRFDNYYEPELPYVDAYNMVIVADAATRIAAFRTQLVDFFPTFSTPRKPEADALVKQYGDKITYVRVVAPGKRGVIINATRPPFDDPEIRQAMHLAIDRNAVNALHHDGVGILAGPYLGLWDWIYSFDDYFQWPGFRSYPEGRFDEDLAESKRILESKGFGPDNRLKVSFNAGTVESDEVTIGDGLDDSWIDVTFDRQPGATRLERSRARDFDAFFESKGTEFDDPDAYNGLLYIPSAGINFTGWEDDRWLELNALQAAELNQAQRGEYLREMADIIFDTQIFVGAIRPRLNQINWSYMVGYVHPKFSHQSTYRWDHVWLNKETAPSKVIDRE